MFRYVCSLRTQRKSALIASFASPGTRKYANKAIEKTRSPIAHEQRTENRASRHSRNRPNIRSFQLQQTFSHPLASKTRRTTEPGYRGKNHKCHGGEGHNCDDTIVLMRGGVHAQCANNPPSRRAGRTLPVIFHLRVTRGGSSACNLVSFAASRPARRSLVSLVRYKAR